MANQDLLVVTSPPHIKSKITTQRIMLDVIIALMPTVAASVWLFGPITLLACAVSICSCVFFEWASQKLFKRQSTINDLSAVVTGLLLAMGLPSTAPLWVYPIGALFAIVFVKQLFGGIGENFANPAIVARIVLVLSFTSLLTNYATPTAWYNKSLDVVTSATPLDAITSASPYSSTIVTLPSLRNMFFGLRAGAMGETCAVALLLGGLYLVVRGVIQPTIPLAFIGTEVLLAWAFGYHPLYSLLSGGLLLGAIFMATDYATTPSTFWGKLIFGIGCGVITAVIRYFGAAPEGVSYAILLMNLVTPLIDRHIRQKPFGAD
jgi:electron transport complex protein RnfD